MGGGQLAMGGDGSVAGTGESQASDNSTHSEFQT